MEMKRKRRKLERMYRKHKVCFQNTKYDRKLLCGKKRTLLEKNQRY